MVDKKPRLIPECIGPCCAYDAQNSRSPTGFTWPELQAHREATLRRLLALRGIAEPDLETLLSKPVPTYEKFYDIKPKKKADADA